MYYYTIGRDNLALTVFVPWDCSNSCAFCTSKGQYRANPPDLKNVKYQIKKFFAEYDFPVKDVVFTGGEPLMDVDSLADLVDLVPEGKNVYVNTTMVRTGFQKFKELIGSGKIKGVNISRHAETFEEDCKNLSDIVSDEEIGLIECPVRINVVLDKQNMKGLVSRWRGKKVVLNLRADYRTMTPEKLHDPYSLAAMELLENGYKFTGHTQCNVCDTTYFKHDDPDMPDVMYHKGLQSTAIFRDKMMEINDMVIDQAGHLGYDWGRIDFELLDDMLRISQKAKPKLELTAGDVLRSLTEAWQGCGCTKSSGQAQHYYSPCGGSGC